jgi:hypothetical protein
MKYNQQKAIPLFRELMLIYMKDRILLFAIVVISILSLGNIVNKIILGFEPVQYSFFSYDKILHFLLSVIIVRIIYRFILFLDGDRLKHPRLIASVLTFVLYGLIWEPFELFTFLIQESHRDQFWQEFFDVPLDWAYDIAGVLMSNFLGYD